MFEFSSTPGMDSNKMQDVSPDKSVNIRAIPKYAYEI